VSYPQQPPVSPEQAYPTSAYAPPPADPTAAYAPPVQPGAATYAPPVHPGAATYAPPVHPGAAYPGPAAFAPPPQPYPAQPAYPNQQHFPQQQPFPAPQGQPAQLAVSACRFCGCVPAAPAKFRGHQGFVVVMRFLSLDGPFCRDCGLSTFRSMTSKTLVQGWYGYASFIITPITVLMNIARRGKVAHLSAPQPNPWGPSRRPMDPGPHLLARPMTLIGLGIPVALLILFIVAITLSGS
jgi:hypothetical protein